MSETITPVPITDAVQHSEQVRPVIPSHTIFSPIDGLRGIACLGVLFYHLSSFATGASDKWIQGVFSYGRFGVELFFVISGFCLTYSLFAHPDRPADWARYARNRARRILPPYWASYVLVALLTLGAGRLPQGMLDPALTPHIDSYRHLILGFLLMETYLNSVYWTLCLEARWYMILPALLAIQRRFGFAWMLAVTALASASFLYVVIPRADAKGIWRAIHFLASPLPFYLPVFGLGIYAAWLIARRGEGRNSRFGSWLVGNARWLLALSLFAMPLLIPADPLGNNFDYLHALVPSSLVAFFVVLVGTSDRTIGRLLSWNPLVLVGAFSYSLYLIHVPLIELVRAFIGARGYSGPLVVALGFTVLPAALIGLAWLFYKAFEAPFVTKRKPAMRQGTRIVLSSGQA